MTKPSNIHGIDLNGAGLNGGNGRLSQEKVEKLLTAEMPMSAGYRPNSPTIAFWSDSYVPLVRVLYDVEAMCIDSAIALPLAYYKSGIAHIEVEIKGSSPEVEQFAHAEFEKFWERCLEQVQHGYEYGWNGYEPMYETSKGLLGLDRLESFIPFDTAVLTKDKNFHGVRVKNVTGVKGPVDLWAARPGLPAKGFWYVHHPRYNRYYGRTQMFAAWRPWRRLSGRDAAEDIMDAAVYRLGYKGPLGRFPAEDALASPSGDVYQSLRSKMLEMCENAKAGHSVAFSSRRDEHGQYVYDLEWPDHVINVSGLIEYAEYLQKKISWGIGTPPELIEASEVGSGYSGRAIPMEGFFTTQHNDARSIVRQWKEQLADPMVQWNFGPEAKFTIKVKPILETKIRTAQKLAQPEQPPGGMPGAGGPPGAAQAMQGQMPGQQAAPEQGGSPLEALLGGGGEQPPEQQPGGMKPLQFALEGGWRQYIGPHGGTGWKNASTGRIIYGGGPPGGGAQGYGSHEEAMQYPVPEANRGAVGDEMHWGDILANRAFNIRVIGETGSGKSTIAQALMGSLDGKLIVLDPVWTPGSWGGLPAITVSPDGDYAPIAQAVDDILEEMKQRTALLQQGEQHFERLTIVADEVPDTVSEVPQLGMMIRRLGQRGRHVNLHVLGIAQSDRVAAWGLEGYGDAIQNFATLYVGNKALEKIPDLAGQERPAVLEWRGKLYPLDMTAVMDLAQRPIDPERIFPLNALEKHLSLGVWEFLGCCDEGQELSLWSEVRLAAGNAEPKKPKPVQTPVQAPALGAAPKVAPAPVAAPKAVPVQTPTYAMKPAPQAPAQAASKPVVTPVQPQQPAQTQQRAAPVPKVSVQAPTVYPEVQPVPEAITHTQQKGERVRLTAQPANLPQAKPAQAQNHFGGFSKQEVVQKFQALPKEHQTAFRQSLGELNKLNADKDHPMFKHATHAHILKPRNGLPAVRTIHGTADQPLSQQEHGKMAQLHGHAAKALRLLGKENLARSHEMASRFHGQAAQGQFKPAIAQPQGAPTTPAVQPQAKPAPQTQAAPVQPQAQPQAAPRPPRGVPKGAKAYQVPKQVTPAASGLFQDMDAHVQTLAKQSGKRPEDVQQEVSVLTDGLRKFGMKPGKDFDNLLKAGLAAKFGQQSQGASPQPAKAKAPGDSEDRRPNIKEIFDRMSGKDIIAGLFDKTHADLKSGKSMKDMGIPEQFAERAFKRGYTDRESVEKAMRTADEARSGRTGKAMQEAVKAALEKHFPEKGKRLSLPAFNTVYLYPETAEALDEVRLALNPWQPYVGPHGGRGWQNSQTQRIIYRKGRPASHEAGRETHEEALADSQQERKPYERGAVLASKFYDSLRSMLKKMKAGEYAPEDVISDTEIKKNEALRTNHKLYKYEFQQMAKAVRNRYGEKAATSPEWLGIKKATQEARNKAADAIEEMTSSVRVLAHYADKYREEPIKLDSDHLEQLGDNHNDLVSTYNRNHHKIADAIDAFRAKHPALSLGGEDVFVEWRRTPSLHETAIATARSILPQAVNLSLETMSDVRATVQGRFRDLQEQYGSHHALEALTSGVASLPSGDSEASSVGLAELFLRVNKLATEQDLALGESNGTVICHIDGPSGSGKTTLAKQIRLEHPDLVVRDLDDFDDAAVALLGWVETDKAEYTDDMLQQLANKRQELMDGFLAGEKNPVVLVGHHWEGAYTIQVPTLNKFLLDVDAETSAKQAYERSQHEAEKYRRLKSELPADTAEAQADIDHLLAEGYVPKSKKWLLSWLAEHKPTSLALSNWTKYRGSRGGHGWKSNLTGKIVYQENMPGENEHGGNQDATGVYNQPAAQPEPQAGDRTAVTARPTGTPQAAKLPGAAEPKQEEDTSERGQRAKLLATQPIVYVEKLGGGVNKTSVVTLQDGTKGVYKPESGEEYGYKETNGQWRPLREAITDRYYAREAAVSDIAHLLGMDDLVPLTVVRQDNGENASFQCFAPDCQVATSLLDKDRYDGEEDRARAAALDYLVGNTDRHAGNWLINKQGKMVLIDHGLSFPDNHEGGSQAYILCTASGMEKGEKVLPIPDSVKNVQWADIHKVMHKHGLSLSAMVHAKMRYDDLQSNSNFGELFDSASWQYE